MHAAAGGVGSGAVQLGKAAGARVIGVVGGPEKTAVAGNSARTWSSTGTPRTSCAVVKEVTGGRGADVVYDPVGGDAFRKSTKCIAFEGRILVVGFASGDIPSAALNHALVKNYSILGLHWGLYAQRDPARSRDCHAELTRLADAGTIRPLISERLTLADVPDGAAAARRRDHHRPGGLPALSVNRRRHGGAGERVRRRCRSWPRRVRIRRGLPRPGQAGRAGRRGRSAAGDSAQRGIAGQ